MCWSENRLPRRSQAGNRSIRTDNLSRHTTETCMQWGQGFRQGARHGRVGEFRNGCPLLYVPKGAKRDVGVRGRVDVVGGREGWGPPTNCLNHALPRHFLDVQHPPQTHLAHRNNVNHHRRKELKEAQRSNRRNRRNRRRVKGAQEAALTGARTDQVSPYRAARIHHRRPAAQIRCPRRIRDLLDADPQARQPGHGACRRAATRVRLRSPPVSEPSAWTTRPDS